MILSKACLIKFLLQLCKVSEDAIELAGAFLLNRTVICQSLTVEGHSGESRLLGRGLIPCLGRGLHAGFRRRGGKIKLESVQRWATAGLSSSLLCLLMRDQIGRGLPSLNDHGLGCFLQSAAGAFLGPRAPGLCRHLLPASVLRLRPEQSVSDLVELIDNPTENYKQGQVEFWEGAQAQIA